MKLSNKIKLFVHYFGRFTDDKEFNEKIKRDEQQRYCDKKIKNSPVLLLK